MSKLTSKTHRLGLVLPPDNEYPHSVEKFVLNLTITTRKKKQELLKYVDKMRDAILILNKIIQKMMMNLRMLTQRLMGLKYSNGLLKMAAWISWISYWRRTLMIAKQTLGLPKRH